MRILYILSGTNIIGGSTKSFMAMLEAAVNAGHEVAVVCNDNEGITQVLKSRGVKTFVTPYGYAAFPPLSFSARDIVRFIPRFIRDRIVNRKAGKKVLEFSRHFSPDIIHENTSVTGIGSYVACKLGVPHIIHIREYAGKALNMYLLDYKKRLRKENVYPVAITKYLASCRCDDLGVGKTARVIYNGIIDEAEIGKCDEKDPYFLYAGRIEPNKGIGDLIDAYIAYRKNNHEGTGKPYLSLKIAGECNKDRKSYLSQLKRKLKSSDCEKDVNWLGRTMEMQQLYSKAAATIIPSKFEGFGRIAPEAMAMGSLCVIRNSGGLKEQLDNGIEITGDDIALRFSTQEELTNLLCDISDNYYKHCAQGNSNYSEMIRRAQQTVKKLYTTQVFADNLLKLYDDVIKSGLPERNNQNSLDNNENA